jgi:NADPH:quinone reductase-like Zn-dependent oxidoreductase
MKSHAIELVAPGVAGVVAAQREVREPGPGEALVRLAGACLNYRDAIVVWGLLPGLTYPFVPLSDGCGTVIAVGSAVDRVRTGDRVAPAFYPAWIDGPPTRENKRIVLGEGRDGCCAQHLLTTAEALVRVPDHLSDLEAATLPCAGVTAWRAVAVDGVAGPGKTVVVQGTGGVSIFALQIARALGARVIATSSQDEKLERCRTLGADATVNYRTHPDWSAEVRRLTEGRGADVIVDVGGAGSIEQSVRAAAVGGHIAIVGILGGVGDASLSVATAMRRNLTLRGVTVGSRGDFENLCRFLREHQLHPVIGDTFAMEDLGRAVDHLEARRHFGKIAIAIP